MSQAPRAAPRPRDSKNEEGLEFSLKALESLLVLMMSLDEFATSACQLLMKQLRSTFQADRILRPRELNVVQ